MREQASGGKIFFVDGTGAWGNATPGNIAYGASKRAITQLQVLHVCFGDQNVKQPTHVTLT